MTEDPVRRRREDRRVPIAPPRFTVDLFEPDRVEPIEYDLKSSPPPSPLAQWTAESWENLAKVVYFDPWIDISNTRKQSKISSVRTAMRTLEGKIDTERLKRSAFKSHGSAPTDPDAGFTRCKYRMILLDRRNTRLLKYLCIPGTFRARAM